MKKIFSLPILAMSLLIAQSEIRNPKSAFAQGMHFSQYYNAPMLTSPANTGLMPDNDYRVGMNYRTQWAAVPVPYHTFSIYGDMQALRGGNRDMDVTNNWLGLGAAAFSDKAGDGNLSLARYEAFAAYHIKLGSSQMISVGGSVASVQRTIDFSKFTWDTQWDGFAFDGTLPNNEKNAVAKTSYTDVTAGINYAIFPNQDVYLKLSAGLAHINTPKETFLGNANQLGMRPTANIDAVLRAGSNLIITPSAYYSSQKAASEILYGTLFIINVGGEGNSGSRVVLGAYHRWNEAIVGVFGYEWNGLRITTSYDYTTSELGQYINHNGAAEISLRWEGQYHSGRGKVSAYGCPRF